MEGPEQPNLAELDEKIVSIEQKIIEASPSQEIVDIFGEETFLIGGFVRDVALDKNLLNSDFDIMTRSSREWVVKNLHKLGLTEDEDYSFNSDGSIINLTVGGRRVQAGFIGQHSAEVLISQGDITMNCCAFDLAKKRIVNPETLLDTTNKKLKFCSVDQAQKDPWKILSALKQISRIPDLSISDETLEVIKSSIPSVIDYFVSNQSELPELQKICGNINSKEALSFFEKYDTKGIFDQIPMLKPSLEASDKYISVPIEFLNEDVRQKIIDLARKSYGRRFDLDKLFNNKTNSVVYDIGNHNEVISCCLISGERIYTIASTDSDNIVNLVSDLCHNNYNVWATISLSSKHVIDLAQKAGLKPVIDPRIIEKILVNNYPEYKDRILIEQKNGYTTFTKKDSDDSKQVLLVS